MNHKKTMVKIMAFSALLVFLFSQANSYLAYHHDITRIRVDHIYKVDGPADVVVLGNSHANYGINSSLIDDVLETDTLILATSGQNLKQTYYLLKEMFKERGSELVIVEGFSFILPLSGKIDGSIDKLNDNYRDFFNEFKFSALKIEMINSIYQAEMVPQMLFPIFNSHNLWKEPEEIARNFEYQFDRTRSGNTKNTMQTLSKEEADRYRAGGYEYEFELSEENRIWLDKIISLVRENDSRLLTVMMPMYEGFLENTNYEKVSQELEGFMAEHAVQYIDFNKTTGIGSDPVNFMMESAFKDAGIVNHNQHLSYIGQYKATHSTLPLIREALSMSQPMVSDSYTLQGYVDRLDVSGKIVMITHFNPDKKAIDESALEKLKCFRINPDKISQSQAGFIVLDYQTTPVDYKQYWTDNTINAKFDQHEVLSQLGLPFVLQISNANGKCMVTSIDGEHYSTGLEGLMIISYDPLTKSIDDKAFFNVTETTIRYIWD